MGTWGPGNFDSDGACDYLNTVISQMIEVIQSYVGTEPAPGCSFDDLEERLMPSLDILITLSKHYETPTLVELSTVLSWRQRALGIYDATIDNVGPKESFKIQKRLVIEATFDELERLVNEWDDL